MKSLLVLSFALLFVSCATHSPQTNRLVKDHAGKTISQNHLALLRCNWL
jgi:hypothetical protein